MFVSLILDKPQGQITSLDVVSGRVQVRLTNVQQITTITVKLEGESRTRLMSPGRPELKEKPRPVLEVHKVRTGEISKRNHWLTPFSFCTGC
jgi:hypothetical protein